MSVPDALAPGDYTVAFDEATSAQLTLAGFASGGWLTAAQQNMAAAGYPGVILSNPRTISDPNNATVGLDAVDVHVPNFSGTSGSSYEYASGLALQPAQFVVATELLLPVLLAAIRAATAITIALVVKYVFNKLTTPAPSGSPLNPGAGSTISTAVKVFAVIAIALVLFALAGLSRSVRDHAEA